MDSSLTAPRVLIVDRCDESREVLRTALERRGIRILEAPGTAEGLELAQVERPDLILVDVDGVPADSPQSPDALAAASDTVIVLGTVRRASGGQFVRKPYHYAPLIRKIESLLAKAA